MLKAVRTFCDTQDLLNDDGLFLPIEAASSTRLRPTIAEEAKPLTPPKAKTVHWDSLMEELTETFKKMNLSLVELSQVMR